MRLTQALEFPFRPFRVEGEAARLVPLEDRPPCLDRIGDSAFALEQEGAAVERTDVVRVKLECVGPVGERTVRVAGCRLQLAPVGDQLRVVGCDGEPRLDDRGRLLVAVGEQVGAGKEAMFP